MSYNRVTLVGQIGTGFMLDHESHNERFYQFIICIHRDSGKSDAIPVIVSEKLIDVTKDNTGEYVHVEGEYRSFNHQDKDGNIHLFLYVFPNEIEIIDNPEGIYEENSIILEGFLCKQPVYRRTPLGREIGDMLIAVNRAYGKSDYIPCIAWGRNAQYANRQSVGTFVHINGRIQSRKYEKDGTMNTCYEVSVIDLEFN